MQSIQIELWQLITAMVGLAGAFAGTVWALSGLLLKQIDQRLDERFQAMEAARQQSSRHWDERFAAVIAEHRSEAESWKRLEREFLEFQARLPLEYVRREDYIRGQTVIEAKIDAVYSKLEVVLLKGAKHG